jgi:hypothetical protein
VSRYTILADVAGRRSLATAGSDRMTAAAVAIETSNTESVRSRVRQLPKWRDCTPDEAEAALQLLAHSASVAVVSTTKDVERWPEFWDAAKPLHEAIVAQDGRPAGFIKPSNVALFALLAHAYGIALGHAVRVSRGTRILDYRGLELVERTIVCDTDIQGEENLSAFESFFQKSDQHQPRMAELGFRFETRDVIVTTEEDEPLLLLADYAAGIAHSAHIANPGKLPLPIPHDDAKVLLQRLDKSGKLVVLAKPFDVEYAEIFGDALNAAANQRAR